MDAAATPDLGDFADPSFLAAYAVYEARVSRLQADAKRAAARFAAVLCSCPARFDWTDRFPAQAGCPVHGNIVITPDGTVL